MNQKLYQDDGVKEQCVNQSGTAENGSEHVACQVQALEKVVTTWLVDTGAGRTCDAEVCVATVGRTYIANNNCDIERSGWTRPWSH